MSDLTDDHRTCVMVSAAAARILLQIDLEAAVQNARKALDVGPILNPTLWRANHEKLEQDLVILRAALPLREKARELAEAHQLEGVE